jgi:hypothetical protein
MDGGLFGIDFNSEMANIVKFNFLFAVPDHKSSGVNLEILLIQHSRKDRVMV